jgi:hypothetical protein
MSTSDPRQPPAPDELLPQVAARLRALTIAVTLLALAVLLLFAAQYGSLVNFWYGDALFFGATSIGAALVGFAFGFFAGRRR